MKKLSVLTAISLTFLLLTSIMLTARASGLKLVTPTPGPDGRILWIVDEGQNCSQIATLANITLAQLRALNGLDEACSLIPGQKLVIGNGGPSGSSPTPAPQSTATPAAATSTPVPGSIDVCVLLYDDQNGDALHQDLEPGIAGGAISISGSSGQYSKTSPTTVALDPPICFDKVPVGTYTISVAAPAGYNPTTLLNYTLEIKQQDVKVGTIQPGDKVYVNFGAQKSSQAPSENKGSNPSDDNSIIGIIGGVLLLAAIGLGIYAWRAGRKPKYIS